MSYVCSYDIRKLHLIFFFKTKMRTLNTNTVDICSHGIWGESIQRLSYPGNLNHLLNSGLLNLNGCGKEKDLRKTEIRLLRKLSWIIFPRRFFYGHCPLVTPTQYTDQSIQSRTDCGWEFCKYCKVLRSLNHIQNNVELTSMRKDHKTLDNNSYSFRETRLRQNKQKRWMWGVPS